MADNRIVVENSIVEGRATKDYWDVPHSTQIEGFTTDFSVNAGTTVDFKINVNGDAGSDYKIEIFRLGYYGGAGAREVAEFTNTNATVQPDALYDESRALVDAGNWSVTDSWDVPADAVSGVYLARVQRLDANGNPIDGAVNQIPFVVRNDGVEADIVMQTSDTTWQAYNGWFGNNGQVGANLYGDASGTVNHPSLPDDADSLANRAYAVSYNRPFITRDGSSPSSGAQDYLFGADYAAIYWLEQNGYDVSYISGVDTDRLGADYLTNYDAFLSVGHDEYWSGDQRDNVEAARDAGVNLMFLSGNEVYWKTRWETSISADGTEYRTLVCYKETRANVDPNAGPEDYANLDPSNIWTGTWRDTRFLEAKDADGNYIAGGADPDPISGLCAYCNCAENSLTGQLFGPDGTGQFEAIDVDVPFAGLRVWRDTSVADGGQLNIAPGILGYEWNTSPTDDLRPAGLIKLSETTVAWDEILVDDGNTTAPGVATHNLSLYRAPSGALVFGAGTVFWTWGLSNQHDGMPYDAQIANVDIQQFMVNMFADMGIQPGVSDAVLESFGLVRALASTDLTPAVATLNTLADTVSAEAVYTITGTATDIDGNALTADGKVAVVELSFDGGETWKVATSDDGWATWSYDWLPLTQGTFTIMARAIDDSLNVYNAASDTDTVTVTAPVPPPSFTLFGLAPPSSVGVENDHADVELGMRFTVSQAGTISALRYWRAEGDSFDTDVRTGHLWSSTGALLGTVTFTSAPGESGWQVASLTTPVGLVAGAVYTVSYHTSDNYVSTSGFFSPANEVAYDGTDDNAFTNGFGNISAPESGTTGNGVYGYGATPTMPTASFGATNYWVDVVFDPADPGTNASPTITSAGAYSVAENQLAVGTVTATDPDGDAVVYSIAGGADGALFTINATTGALSFASAPNFEAPADAGANNVYDVVVRASDTVSTATTKAVTVTVTDVDEQPVVGSSLFTGATPAGFSTDATDYQLGTKFTVNRAGEITHLQYYRGAADAGDTDTRTLSLWRADGTLIATAVVSSTSGQTGWQVAQLASAVTVQAGSSYIVGYAYDQDGVADAYAYSTGYFATGHSSSDGSLTAPASGAPSGSSGGGVGNGLFSQTLGALPQNSYNGANYWVDVVFNAAPQVNVAPVITSSSTFTLPENRASVGTVAATDSNGDALTYSIVGGADAGDFIIDASTGALRFATAPDFEAPADADANNTYAVTVAVSDGTAPAVQQALTVTVTDVVETPGVEPGLDGHLMQAQYIFGSTATTLYPSSGASQTATVNATPGSVEFTALPPAGSSIGNGNFGLAAVDLTNTTVRIEFPADMEVFSQGYAAFASVASAPFNGVRVTDADGTLPDILGVTIVDQKGFTNSAGASLPLTAADFTVTADGIFLNMAGRGRLVDADPTVAGQQAAYVVLELDISTDTFVFAASSASTGLSDLMTTSGGYLLAHESVIFAASAASTGLSDLMTTSGGYLLAHESVVLLSDPQTLEINSVNDSLFI